MQRLRSHPIAGLDEIQGDDFETLDEADPGRSLRKCPPAPAEAHSPWEARLGCGFLSVPLSPKAKAPRSSALHLNATPAAGAGDNDATAALGTALQRDCPTAFAQLAATHEPINGAFLQRWLTARGSVEAATAAIAAHAAWRSQFVGAGGVAPARIAAELAAQKIHLQGLDPGGCPVVLFQAARHVPSPQGVDTTMLLMCYALDAAVAAADARRNPLGRVCCVFDLTGLATRNLDVRFLLQLFDLLQTHYPERLARLFFVNAPLIFWGVWRCVSPFVAPATRAKLVFASGAAGRAQLVRELGSGVLPHTLGGVAELLPVDAAVEGRAAVRLREESVAVEETGGGAAGPLSFVRSGASAVRGGAAAVVHTLVQRPIKAAAQWRNQGQRSGGLGGDGGGVGQALLGRVALTRALLLGLLLCMLGATLDTARRLKELAGGGGSLPAAGGLLEGGAAADVDQLH